MFEKVIYHIDVNSAFLSWEAVYRISRYNGTLDLREIPSAVGGDMAKRHGIILAKSIPARKYKIHTGEPITDAKKKCPDLMLVPPHYELYKRSSEALISLLKEYSPQVEQFSIDEAFVDMSGMQGIYGDLVEMAHKIKDRIYREFGFTVNVGVSSNKLLAKMASDFQKPNRVHTLFPQEVPAKMWPLPVEELYFVGRATAKKMRTLGIRTIGELAGTDPDILKYHLKKHGEVIWNFANGRDVSLVDPEPAANKGYGNSTTIAFDVQDPSTAKMILLALAETVGKRIRKDSVKIGVVSVSIKDFDLLRASHQKVLEAETDITYEIHRAACELFDEMWDGTPIRLLGIHTGRVVSGSAGRQMELFDDTDYEKLACLDRTVDAIRGRHGLDMIKRAAFLENPIDHLSGGIAREKRKVDYSKLDVK